MPRFSVEYHDLTLEKSLRSAGTTHDHRPGLIVRLEAGSYTGLGEARPLSGWTESLASCKRVLKELDGARVSWREWREWLARLSQNDLPATRHAIHQAGLDWQARFQGQPLFRSLSGRSRPAPVWHCPVVGAESPTVLSRRYRLTAGRYSVVKVKLGLDGPGEDRRRLKALAEESSTARLRLDVNGSWNVGTVGKLLGLLRTLPVEYVEQPLPAGCWGLTETLPRDIDWAWDEELMLGLGPGALRQAPVQGVVVKPMVLGGLDRALRTMDQARSMGLEPVVSSSLGGRVARWGLVHLAASRSTAPAGLALSRRTPEGFWPKDRANSTVPLNPGAGLRFLDEVVP